MKLQFRHQPFQAEAENVVHAVFRDSSFISSLEKINVFEIFKLLAPNTNVRVI